MIISLSPYLRSLMNLFKFQICLTSEFAFFFLKVFAFTLVLFFHPKETDKCCNKHVNHIKKLKKRYFTNHMIKYILGLSSLSLKITVIKKQRIILVANYSLLLHEHVIMKLLTILSLLKLLKKQIILVD